MFFPMVYASYNSLSCGTNFSVWILNHKQLVFSQHGNVFAYGEHTYVVPTEQVYNLIPNLTTPTKTQPTTNNSCWFLSLFLGRFNPIMKEKQIFSYFTSAMARVIAPDKLEIYLPAFFCQCGTNGIIFSTFHSIFIYSLFIYLFILFIYFSIFLFVTLLHKFWKYTASTHYTIIVSEKIVESQILPHIAALKNSVLMAKHNSDTEKNLVDLLNYVCTNKCMYTRQSPDILPDFKAPC